jgi:hypothetical protein
LVSINCNWRICFQSSEIQKPINNILKRKKLNLVFAFPIPMDCIFWLVVRDFVVPEPLVRSSQETWHLSLNIVDVCIEHDINIITQFICTSSSNTERKVKKKKEQFSRHVTSGGGWLWLWVALTKKLNFTVAKLHLTFYIDRIECLKDCSKCFRNRLCKK